MYDIWGFLVQTLNASGVAILLLIIKALFKDKLSPKWHFEVWSVLMAALLFPAGIFGRYAFFNCQIAVDFLRTLSGDYGFSRNFLPFPYIKSAPETVADYIFIIYVLGVIISALIYLISYIRLRFFIKKAELPDEETLSHIYELAENNGIKPCRVVLVRGMSGAFLCGIFRPVLVISGDGKVDDKILLHEFMHFKYKDTFLSAMICFFRCLHWCNPLISYCADRAINDMESRCDQAVLERLEGESRRDYGFVLLSMVNERFSKTPGSTCINNGGKKISRRVEAIARFKKYPVGMGLASVCITFLLIASCIIGTQASVVRDPYGKDALSVSQARTTVCKTPAGAIDTYAKAVIKESALYRLMCAPEGYQKKISDELKSLNANIEPTWDNGLSGYVDSGEDYRIYNLHVSDNTYYGNLVFLLATVPEDMEWEENHYYYAYQEIRAENENGRWVVYPEGKFNYTSSQTRLDFGIVELPSLTYTATVRDFKIDIKFQSSCSVDNKVQNNGNDPFAAISGTSYSYTRIPKPDSKFDMCYRFDNILCTHSGSPEERKEITRIGISYKQVMSNEEKSDTLPPATGSMPHVSSGSDRTGSASLILSEDWGPEIWISGSGEAFAYEDYNKIYPEYYVADLYINNELYAQAELYPEEEI